MENRTDYVKEKLTHLVEDLKKGKLNVKDYTCERDKIFGKQTLFESIVLPILGVYIEKDKNDEIEGK